MHMYKLILSTALLSIALAASPVLAGNGNGKAKPGAEAKGNGKSNGNGNGSVGNASGRDVSLNDEIAQAFKYSGGINPHGKDGASGFAADFKTDTDSTAWNHLADFETAPAGFGSDDAILLDSKLLFTFSNSNGLKGNWSVQNTDLGNNLTLDLVFAMHTGGGSGAWLFDNQTIAAGQTLTGDWSQKMFNNGGNMGGFSNLTLFVRDASASPVVLSRPSYSPAGGSAGLPVEIAEEVFVKVPSGGNSPIAGDIIDDFELTPSADVPEPATLGSMVLGLGLMGYLRRRSRV